MRRHLPKIVAVILIIAIIGFITYYTMNPFTVPKYTEFYVLNEFHSTSWYPVKLNLRDTGSVILGVINHEQTEETYALEVEFEGRQIKNIDPIVLKDSEKYESVISFKPATTGAKQKIEFLLYKGNDRNEPYRSLHLIVDVVP